MTELERIEKLEKKLEYLELLCDDMQHNYDDLAIIIPKLTDILIKYWGKQSQNRNEVIGNMQVMGNLVKSLLNEHYKTKKTLREHINFENKGSKEPF